jgi:hypothetical protein
MIYFAGGLEGLRLSRKYTSFERRGCAFKRCLAYGSMVLPIVSVVRFFALRAKKRTTKEDKVPL